MGKIKQMKLPELTPISFEHAPGGNCAFVFAMGFEDRALAIPALAANSKAVKSVIGIKYAVSKGDNKETAAKGLFSTLGKSFLTVNYSTKMAHEFEYKIRSLCKNSLQEFSEVVVDISAMSKLLILVLIVVLLEEKKLVRIVFASAREYAPTQDEYNKIIAKVGEERLTAFAGQPSSGISAILRSVCLSSTRMQGQPVCAVAFTSFNEELIRHSVGTLNPHRLILINGIPPKVEFFWRALATQKIHQKLINEYSEENPISNKTGLLERSVSTLNYLETLDELLKIREHYGTYERIIYFATGSKMQTVALAMLKAAFSDVHIEYPTPDSYYFQEYSKGVGEFSTFLIDNTVIDSIKNHHCS